MSNERAASILLIANNNGSVHYVNEIETIDGVAFSGVWSSRNLSKDSFRHWTLSILMLRYTANADGAIKIRYTRDGGLTWTAPVAHVLPAAGSTYPLSPWITGRDIRFELTLDDRDVIITGFAAEILDGGIYDA